MATPPGMSPPSGPPYAPRVAGLGGRPTKSVDIPISAVFLVLFIGAAATHMTLLQVNLRRKHKFIISGVTFGFCMARIMANIMRIAWACNLENVRLAIAAGVFANAGVLVLYVVNILFLQRIVRAFHPKFGWSQPFRWAFRFLYFGIFACLVMLITAVVYSFYTLDPNALSKIRYVRLVAGVYIAVLAFIPIPGVLLAILVPRSGTMDKFGQGSMRTKVILLLCAATLLSLGAWYRAGISFLDARPPTNPGWYNSKAAFYCFSYVLELIVVYSYAILRIDRRFHIPDGSSEPGHYSNGGPGEKGSDQSIENEEGADQEAQLK